MSRLNGQTNGIHFGIIITVWHCIENCVFLHVYSKHDCSDHRTFGAYKEKPTTSYFCFYFLFIASIFRYVFSFLFVLFSYPLYSPVWWKNQNKKERMCFNFFQRKSIFIKPSVLCVYGCACIRAIMEHQRIQNYIFFLLFLLVFLYCFSA